MVYSLLNEGDLSKFDNCLSLNLCDCLVMVHIAVLSV